MDLRLAIAREDALAFQAGAKRTFAEAMEKSRMPTPAELAAIPGDFSKAEQVAREARYLLADAAVTAQSLARAMTSKGLKGAAEELRRARSRHAGPVRRRLRARRRACAPGRPGAEAALRIRAGDAGLRARYAELLARAPVLTEKGKQFLVRLELERRAEQLLETSGSVSDWARQRPVGGIAYLIAGIRIYAGEDHALGHKQLAPVVAGSGFAPAAPAPEEVAQPSAGYAAARVRLFRRPQRRRCANGRGPQTGPCLRKRLKFARPATRGCAIWLRAARRSPPEEKSGKARPERKAPRLLPPAE